MRTPLAPLGERVMTQAARPEERWPHQDAARRGRCCLLWGCTPCECCTSVLELEPPLLPDMVVVAGDRVPLLADIVALAGDRAPLLPDMVVAAGDLGPLPWEMAWPVLKRPAPILSERLREDLVRSRISCSRSGGTLKRPPFQPWRASTQRTFQELSANPRIRSDSTVAQRGSSLLTLWCRSEMASSNSSCAAWCVQL